MNRHGEVPGSDMTDQYRQLRDELECAIDSYAATVELLQIALRDLEEEVHILQTHLTECDQALCNIMVRRSM